MISGFSNLQKFFPGLQKLSATLQNFSATLRKFSATLQKFSANLRNLSAALQKFLAGLQKFSATPKNLFATLPNHLARLEKYSAEINFKRTESTWVRPQRTSFYRAVILTSKRRTTALSVVAYVRKVVVTTKVCRCIFYRPVVCREKVHWSLKRASKIKKIIKMKYHFKKIREEFF